MSPRMAILLFLLLACSATAKKPCPEGGQCPETDEGVADDESALLQRRKPKHPVEPHSHLSKQRADPSKLLRQAEVIKNTILSGNLSNGSFNLLIADMVNEMETNVIPPMNVEHTGDVHQQQLGFQAFADCETTQLNNGHSSSSTLATQMKNAHDACRLLQAPLNLTNASKCHKMQTWQNSLMEDCAPLNGAGMTSKSSLENLKVQADYYHAEKVSGEVKHTACTIALSEAKAKHTLCEANQITYEESYCAYKDKLTTACDGYKLCYTNQVASFGILQDNIAASAKHRKATYKAAKLIGCYVQQLNKSNVAQKAGFKACDTDPITDSQFTIVPKVVPAEKPCSKTPVQHDTCDAVWRNSVYDGTWTFHAPPAACLSCSR